MFSIASIRCGFVVCFMMLQWAFFLEMLLLERKVFYNFLDTVKAAPHDCLISLL